MADPIELKKQLEELNKEFDQLNKAVASVASRLGGSLTGAVVDATKLADELGKGKNVTAGIEAQLLKNKKALEANILNEIKYRAENKKRLADNLVLQRQILYQLDTQLRSIQKINEEYQKQNNLFKILDDKLKDVYKSVKNFISVAAVFKSIIDSGLRFNKISVDIGKNIGYGADNANRFAKELVRGAQSSDNLNFTLQNAADAANEINTATGYVAEYSADALETQIMLTKQFNLTADEAAGIYKFSVLTGKSSSVVNDNMVKAFVATKNQLGKAVPFKATMAEAAKVSGVLASNLRNNPEAIVKAIVQAKALGTSLEQTAKQGESLLNFESSIENELKAELLTGRQLNLERARAAALAGDNVTLAQELAKNVGSVAEFDRMNVLQKRAIAEAVGLTTDELAEQLRKQEIARKNGESLAQLTEREAKEAQKRQNIQEKINQSILKLQDSVGNLVAGPMASFIDGLSTALDYTGKIFSVFGKITEAIKGLLGNKISSVLGGAASAVTIGALVTIIGKSLMKGTYTNPMITKDFDAAGDKGGSLTDAILGKKAGGQFKKGGGRVPKGGRTGGFLKGAGGKSLLGMLGGIGLNYASEAAAGAGNENLSKALSIGGGILSGASTGALLGSIIPGLGTAVGGVAGGIIGGLGSLLADDMVGYGARTLITPQGAVALNNNDTVIAGTNLFKGDDVLSMPKGSLNFNMSPIIEAINNLASRPVVIKVDGKEVGSAMVQTSPKSA